MGTFEDWPDAQYRAFMVESSGRVWLPMDTIRRDIREMALCRMNVLQFHFMEDPGCTVPLESVPGFHGGPKGEKFTRQEVDNMIAYAADLGIRVTPFIEILSHAADFALAEGLVCPGDDLKNLYDVCLGQEKTYAAIETVIREIAEIFPDDTIHIGADEYDMSRVTPYTAHWDQCPHCQAVPGSCVYERPFSGAYRLAQYHILLRPDRHTPGQIL
jgi:hexosaminidase